MKKLTNITQLLAALLLLVQFSSCKDLPAPEEVSGDAARPTDELVAGAPVLQRGATVYKPTGKKDARYASAMIANADGTMDAWFSSDGGVYGEEPREVSLNGDGAGGGPWDMHGVGKNGAIKNTFKESFYSWSVHCPAWGPNKPVTSFKWTLFEWKGSYDATLASTPLAQVDHLDYADNAYLTISADNGYTEATGNKKFPKGTYMLFMECIEGTPGCWGQGAQEGQTYWRNGSDLGGTNGYRNKYQFARPVEVSYTSRVMYRSASSAKVDLAWSEDSLVVSTVEEELDRICAAEPSVIKTGGYYYMAYTGTFEKTGKANKVFVARSAKPDGVWEKWNGAGWGGAPKPVVDYTGDVRYYGIGQPSLVIKDSQIFLYYTYSAADSVSNTNLAVAPVGDNWPSALADKGMVIDRSKFTKMDGASVKYIDELSVFQAVHAANREQINSSLVVWESADGQTGWTLKNTVFDNMRIFMTYPRYISDDQGHVTSTLHMLTYNFGQGSGAYKTQLAPYEFAK